MAVRVKNEGIVFEGDTVAELLELITAFGESGADDDWVEWNGGEMPPVSNNTKVEVIYRRGDKRSNRAVAFAWHHDGPGSRLGDIDIVAYRVVK